ncbi:DUF5723 family protein [Bacteroides gallinaceum]|uniref:DUF5723 family protein n=1 Tax=Bacteroides gallinaceum TaxID=1462571 RepID=A0ABT7X1E1_9BACE|nr:MULTISPECIES: DUF5723 family protein [Bacteroides]MBM6657233.1 hypothetical protein [Bacteroides gallinaceum]MBM6943615.1 hypothetical protein [Bacteroides gallinaceum]MDN0047899.1 DUF5723 family protein [Bacteroides gallinaceum]OUO63374.1 hypothetical protein B5F78_00170 [Bacteroides sp. An279]
MKGFLNRRIWLVAGSLLLGMTMHAQYLRTSYFMEGTSSRLELNPGLQPMRGYFNIPVLGSFNVGTSSNVLGINDIIDVLDSGEDIFLNDDLYSRLKSDNRLNVNLKTDVLSFGWYAGKGFWNVNVGLRADVGASIPQSMFEYLRRVNNTEDINGSFSNMNFNLNAYAEIGLGYSRQITEKLSVGGRVKVLLGIARAEMAVDNFDIYVDDALTNGDYTELNPYQTYGSATVNARVSTTMKGGGLSFDETTGQIDGFDIDGSNFGIAGAGFGIDLGASYKVWDNLTVSAAVLDLGFIKWKEGETTVAAPANGSFEVTGSNYQDFLDGDFLSMDRFNFVQDKEAAEDTKTTLASTILLAGEYGLLDNKLSVGAIYTARFAEPKTLNELTFSATYRPKNWFNIAASYSPIQAGGKSFGLALKLGALFLGTDYMYFGNSSKAVNAFIGLSIPLGKSRD